MNKTATGVNVEARLSRADPALGHVIRAVIPRLGKLRPVPSDLSPFEALARAVVYQRMSYKAAETIYNRLRLKAKQKLTPDAVLALPDRTLRAVGLSDSKAKSIQNLAKWFIANPSLVKNLDGLSNQKLIEALTSISGIGIWTVNVFLIFHLQRLDVVPAADLGIRRGVQLAYGLSSIASPDLVEKKARRWRPYRSIASMYLWQSVKLKLKRDDLK